jgi:hypothetical protein
VITTPELIAALAADATPVRRLRPPLARAAAWLIFAVFLLAALAVVHGLRPDLAERLRQPVFALAIVASLVTGTSAAIASFLVSLPDRSRLWLLLPAPSLVVWLSTIGYGCLTAWVSLGPAGVRAGETVRCFLTLVVTSLPLSLVLLVMLRHAAPLRPTMVTMTGSLSVAAITATVLSLFHNLDATVLILIWNIGTSVLIIALASTFGPKMFSWVSKRTILGGSGQKRPI